MFLKLVIAAVIEGGPTGFTLERGWIAFAVAFVITIMREFVTLQLYHRHYANIMAYAMKRQTGQLRFSDNVTENKTIQSAVINNIVSQFSESEKVIEGVIIWIFKGHFVILSVLLLFGVAKLTFPLHLVGILATVLAILPHAIGLAGIILFIWWLRAKPDPDEIPEKLFTWLLLTLTTFFYWSIPLGVITTMSFSLSF